MDLIKLIIYSNLLMFLQILVIIKSRSVIVNVFHMWFMRAWKMLFDGGNRYQEGVKRQHQPLPHLSYQRLEGQEKAFSKTRKG